MSTSSKKKKKKKAKKGSGEEESSEKKAKKKRPKSQPKSNKTKFVSFGEPPPKGGRTEAWYKKIPMLEYPRKGSEKEIRAVLGLYNLFMHWVPFKKQDGTPSGFYLPCPDYVREENRFKVGSKKRCPICLHFHGAHLPEHLNIGGAYKYYFDAFDMTALEDDEGARTFGAVQCGKYGRKDIHKASKRNKADVDDTVKGCTLYWEKDPDADDAKEKEGFSKGRKKKIRWNEKLQCFILKFKDADGKVRKIKGKPTQFDTIVEIPTPEEVRDNLERLGLWEELDKATNKGEKKKKKKKIGKKSKSSRRKREDD